MKRSVLAVLVAVCLLSVPLSMGGCASRAGFGIDTFAALPAAAAVATPDEADVVLYALIVKIVSPTYDVVKAEHAKGHISDVRYVEISEYVRRAATSAREALTAADSWRAGAGRETFDEAYRAAVAAADKVVNAPEVKK